ncbi:TetR/AcrR family transcriptional regulator [Seohaeicola saemankumensis]|nr:TetR/AcrR family transcriptional regulator [Seohaeicola saemankumensis]MCA0871082.1 TetR/AcrR family transcriptional regulator [Seohaeicola saemankumensis]
MNQLPSKLQLRAERKGKKRDEKKRQIAESALSALKELGYASTSLRDIAAKSDLSLGMLHYYFEDKTELIIFCVSMYKREFVRGMSEAIDGAQNRDQMIAAFAEALVRSIIDDKAIHRLWYDIRNQAMFDTAFQPIVEEVESMLIDVVRRALRAAGQPDRDVEIQYALLDGVFRFLMQKQITSDPPPSRQEQLNAMRAVLQGFL